MSEGKSRASRFRRSRFRTSKASQGEGGEAEQQQEAGGEEPEQPQLLQQQVIQEQPEIQPPMAVPQAPARVVKVPLNTLTIDVKEWFQTSACSELVKFAHWGRYERRIERGIHMILALLRRYNVKATFFILGIVAREFPELIRLIVHEGHELGTMGYYNRPLHTIPPREYINEMEMCLSLLKSVTGVDVKIHRAPEWSVTIHTLWILDVLKTYGIKYDSSIFPMSGSLYGIENAPQFPYKIEPQGITEFPPTTYRFLGKSLDLFGGTYMRVLPYKWISGSFFNLNRRGQPVMIHVSPWEVDADFPKLNLCWEGYMAQYAGVKTTFSRLSKLLSEFKFDTLTKAIEDIDEIDEFPTSNFGRIGFGLF
jgi:polysaccharide deacetylase family protein (PEP-CTERM system associated)